MSTLALAILLQTAVAAPGADNYATAYRTAVEEGKPLVVLVGAEWCPACRQMKNSVMPEVATTGSLGKVAYAYVNVDQQKSMSQKLLSGSMIPQLVVFHMTPDGWKRDRLVGAQSPESVAQLLNAAAAPAVANVSQQTSE